MRKKLEVDELVYLVEKICKAEGTEGEIEEAISDLENNVPHPSVTDLIFYNNEEMTPKEIVEQALAYKPISF
ncbi:hypothetical protein GS400_12655 [Pontibacillus sp. HMF3514]|nr:hypothetical protein GS400_12655 [Pontibacillus sp. HMF3514]